jgi:cephalosporin hydroxylase
MNGLLDYLKRKVKRINFSDQDPVVNPLCYEFEVNNWIISDFVVNKLVPVVGVHPYPINEQCLMAAAVCVLKPTHIFEWGTNLGKSARIFYEITHKFSIKTQIYSIDLPDDIEHVEHPKEKRGIYVRNLERVNLLLGDGLETSMKIYNTAKQEAKVVPLFFIDGDHSYNSVKRELIMITKDVPEAAILLHDTFFQSSESGYNIGPYQAVKDVITDSHNYKIIRQDLGLPGMTLLYKKQRR